MSADKGIAGSVPFSPPVIAEEDIEAVVAVLRSGWITTGAVSEQFESELAEFCGTEDVVLQSSCTAGLETALRAAGVGPGDDVLVPAYTFTASAAAVLHVGANLVLVDNAPGQFVPSVSQFVERVTPQTKAVVVVDFAGVPYPSRELALALDDARLSFAPSRFISVDRPLVVADGAHSLGAVREGVDAGALADLTAFSFHAVKNLTTAEGGALTWRPGLVADSSAFAKKLRIGSLHGQTKDARQKNLSGQWEYDVTEPAHKANLPDVLAALGLSQLRRYRETVQQRINATRVYANALEPQVELLPHSGVGFSSSAHLAVVSLPNANVETRNRVIGELAAAGVAANVHYKPLPMMTAYVNLGYDPSDFPNAVGAYERELTLPLFAGITPEQQKTVSDGLLSALEKVAS